MKKIKIPSSSKCFRSNYGSMNYHVSFQNQALLDEFCDYHNIGYGNGNRTDITKSDLCVFTSDPNVFENFPSDTPLYS